MEKKNKILKIIFIVNVIILVASYIFCFQNPQMDVPGICVECCWGRQIPFRLGTILAIGQAIALIVGGIMASLPRSKGRYITINVMSIICVCFAALQVLLFLLEPNLSNHGREFTGKTLEMINMYKLQFNVQKIVNIILAMIQIIAIVIANNELKSLEKEQRDKNQEYYNSMKRELYRTKNTFNMSDYF